MVKTLLDHKANVNFEGLTTPLMTAAMLGHQPIVKDILDHGADVNKESKGSTALLLAATEGPH